MPERPLPFWQILLYGMPTTPIAAVVLGVYLYLPAFYAESLGLGLAAVGAVLLAARLVDAATDPLIGYLSDRFDSRFGRRKLLSVVAAPVLLVAALALFRPPADAGAGHLLFWSITLYLAWTLLLLPYSAWGAELSGDYHERTRVVGAREACVVLGTTLAAAAPLVAPPAPDASPAAGALNAIAWFALLSLPPLLALAVALLPEPPPLSRRQPSLRAGLRAILRNRPFRLLLLAFLCNSTANGLTASLFLLYVGHVLQAADAAGPLLLAYFLAGIVSVPLWLRLSRRLGKDRAWSLGLVLASLLFVAVPFLGAGDFWPFLAVCLATGLCLGADLALPGSMQADVIDLDMARSRAQRTGFFFALWSMATKLALALAVGVAFPLLDAVGFAADAANDAAALAALSLLYGLAPIAIKLAAVGFLWRYPIDAKRQARLRARLERRLAGA